MLQALAVLGCEISLSQRDDGRFEVIVESRDSRVMSVQTSIEEAVFGALLSCLDVGVGEEEIPEDGGPS